MLHLETHALQSEAERLASVMRRHFADRNISTEAILTSLRQAVGFGIREKRAVTSFVVLGILLGEKFLVHPPVKALLTGREQSDAENAVVVLLAELQWNLRQQPEK